MTSLLKTLVQQHRGLLANSFIKSYSTEAMMYETLAVSVPKPNVYHVELNRPKKFNAFNIPMWRELNECFTELSKNAECRVVVLSGQGKHFTGGLDFNSIMEMGQKFGEQSDVARKAKIMSEVIGRFQQGVSALEQCAKPVLSVVHSACVGAGVDLVTASDIRYCTEDAWFQVKEVDIGMAADVGTLQRLPKVIGSASIARELCFTARKFDAKEALAIGFVSKVFPDKDRALEEVLSVASTIACKSPVAVQVTKQSMVYSQSRSTQEGLDHIVSIYLPVHDTTYNMSEH